MNAPRKGIEVDLKELGCPYDVLDPRSLIWLDGYRAGVTNGAKVAKAAYEAAFAGEAE